MSAAVHRDEPGKFASGLMAVVVHVAFFALLVFGVSWQHRAPSVTAVDLWSNLPPVPVVKAPEPPPAPKPEVKPPTPPPEPPKPVQKAVPKPAPEPKPVAKPDIALEKEKQEKARRERDEREKAEAKKREDAAKAETRKKEDAEKKRVEAERAKEAERVRAEREAQEAMKRLQQQQASVQAKEIDMYKAKISDKIKRYVNKEPCAALGNPEISFEAVLMPDGNTLDSPRVLRSSGNAACDQAVLRAVLRAQPLPLPPDPTLFAKFRELRLEFRPNE